MKFTTIKQLLLVMKLSILLLIIGFLQVSATGYSQITLNEKHASLENILLKIKQQTNYNFIYDENKLNVPEISVKVDRVSIQEALDACFHKLPVTYTIIENNIILKRKDQAIAPTAIVELPPASISGIILNEDGKPVDGASIVVKGTSIGTKTNAKGYFRLYNVPDDAVLRITSIGYKPVEVGIRKVGKDYRAYATEKTQAGNLKSDMGEDVVFALRLLSDIGTLLETNIKGEAPKQIGTVVELKHRSHLNLGQVLEGTVPGLTLKSAAISRQDFSIEGSNFGFPGTYTGLNEIKDLYAKLVALNGVDPNVFRSFDEWYNFFYSQLGNDGKTYNLVTTTINNGLIPELRGSSSFTGNTSGMLVVIDGIEQNNFPANYPMNNVASVEVIKDPAELVKWGPKATGGLILITTNGAKAGKLEFNYNSSFYYSPKPNISSSRLQLASSADVLDYYKEQVKKGLAAYTGFDKPVGLKPAQSLLYHLTKNGLPDTDPKFTASWDSLARLSNQDQLRMLYQNTFTQNHSLNISGGIPAYRFILGATYTNSPGTTIGSNSTNLNLNLQNIFNLLKNKLKISWQLNTINANRQSSTAADGSSLDPYQLLLGPKGSYVYDYSGNVGQEMNQAMQKLGYLDYGVNPLEDARNTKNSNKTFDINSRLNMDWNLAKGLQWSTVFLYGRNTGSTHNLKGVSTSSVRTMRDDYGSSDGAGGIDFYIPPGDILNTGNSNSMIWNLRSGLSYSHSFDDRNVLGATLGVGAAHSQSSAVPNATIYGYGPDTPNGLPLLTSPAGGIVNYFGTRQYLSQLLIPGFNTASYDRNLSLNGGLTYAYDNRYILNLQYGSVYTPNVGFIPSYSGTKNYQAIASWQVDKEHFFKMPLISTFKLSAIAGRIQLAKAPGQIQAGSIAQPLWNNTALFASGYTPSQLNGQSMNNIGAALQIGLRQERIQLQASYNHSSDGSHQINGQVAYEISREPWFNFPSVSRLVIDASLQNFNALQAQAIVMGTNTPNANGGFSLASNNSFGILPPATINKEAHLSLGLFKDRLTFDLRYYHKVISSTSGSGLLPPDPSTGLSSQISDSRLLNKGTELYLRGKVIQGKVFSYAITINGAYNVNQALDVPDVPFSQYVSYLTAPRIGYATDALWSYRWAGLDQLGNPQVYKDKDTRVPILLGSNPAGLPISTTLDASSLVYSGRTRPPWSGGLIQEWTYKDFFASARMVFNLGYIMRTYIPVAGPVLDKSNLIGQRWENPGDEAHTDIAAMAQADPTRSLVIRNSSNSIVSADNIRLREVQIGYEVPASILKKGFIKALTVSAQVLNVALWTQNKMGLDPDAVSNDGTVGISVPRQYALTINMSF